MRVVTESPKMKKMWSSLSKTSKPSEGNTQRSKQKLTAPCYRGFQECTGAWLSHPGSGAGGWPDGRVLMRCLWGRAWDSALLLSSQESLGRCWGTDHSRVVSSQRTLMTEPSFEEWVEACQDKGKLGVRWGPHGPGTTTEQGRRGFREAQGFPFGLSGKQEDRLKRKTRAKAQVPCTCMSSCGIWTEWKRQWRPLRSVCAQKRCGQMAFSKDLSAKSTGGASRG